MNYCISIIAKECESLHPKKRGEGTWSLERTEFGSDGLNPSLWYLLNVFLTLQDDAY